MQTDLVHAIILAYVSVTHVAYSDESHHNVGRYRCIGVVTAPLAVATEVASEVRAMLTVGGVRELKWEKVRTARERFAALRVADCLFSKLNVLRADVLTWDTEDSRHQVRSRDDVANLHRMYHHLFRTVLRRRWPTGSTWRLYPDEQDSMDWNSIHDILSAVSMTTSLQRSIGEQHSLKLSLRTHYRIMQIVPSRSEDEPLIQIADLLAGMSAFSRTHFDEFREWSEDSAGQSPLFQHAAPSFSTGMKEKCAVLSEFHRRSRLNSSRGLTTRNPKCSLNFWPYVPQRASDKAPQKRLARRP